MTNSDSPDEDIGNLRQMKAFASDLYDKRINARGGSESGDRFAQEVGNIIHHVDKAIDERLAEKNGVAHVSVEGCKVRINAMIGDHYEVITSSYSSPVIENWNYV